MLEAECLVVCLVAWVEWVEWVEWECNPIYLDLKIIKPPLLNTSGVFFYLFVTMSLQCPYNVVCFRKFPFHLDGTLDTCTKEN